MGLAANGAADREHAGSAADATPVGDVIATWRGIVLARALWLTLGVVLAAMIAVTVQGGAFVNPLALRLLPGLVVLASGLAWRDAPQRLRAWTLLGGLQIAILGAALDSGFNVPNTFVAAMLLCVLAALVLDRPMAWVAMCMTGLVWLVIANAFVRGRAIDAGSFTDIALPANWLRVVAIYLVIAAAAVSAVQFLVRRLEQALQQREALYQALVTESEQRLAAVTQQNALEARLQQSQRLESLGRLAGGVAHDFNNLLMVIMSNAEIVAQGEDETSLRGQAAHDIVSATDRAAALTGQLLAFSRRQRQDPVAIDVAEGVQSALAMLRRLLPSSISLRTEFEPDLPAAWGAAFAVEQIVMNLCINARDAMPEGGELAIRTATEQRPGPREYVLLSVSDTGFGMDAQTVRRVFEPFFTTKPVGEGTGLGLSMVRGLARQSEGFVELRSTPGEGTTFDVYLAVAQDGGRGPEVRDADLAATTGGGSEMVLVVDDDPGVRPVLVAALRRAGYEVLEASDGEAGLALFRRHAEQIALVVSDAIMPRMGGQAMLAQILALRPGMRFLVCSGYTAEMFDTGFFERPGRAFLLKPFKPAVLVERVRQLLDA